MKKCIVISDSFKGSLSSSQICDIARQTVPRVFPDAELISIPVADGGEGTVSCFIEAIDAFPVTIRVSGPFGKPMDATYARKGSAAIIEMSSCAGLPLVTTCRDPEKTTTYGVGELIAHAVRSGASHIILGLGGSATNDGGCGCAAALGVRFLNADGKEFIPTGGTLRDVAHIDDTACRELLKGVSVTAMCDVNNPLCGPMGAAHIFGPQKGANASCVQRLDEGLLHLSHIWKNELHADVLDMPGAGAAGGFGGGACVFLHAELKSGIETVLDMVAFNTLLDGTDYVITGEGKLDEQSINGKVISGIAARTAAHHIPLIAIVGCVDALESKVYQAGVSAVFPITRQICSYEECIKNAASNYARTLEDVLRLIRAAE